MTDPVWVAFLRGMNLGGRRLTNDELRAAVTACGCDDVETYQASGNVILHDARPHDELAAALEDGLEAGGARAALAPGSRVERQRDGPAPPRRAHGRHHDPDPRDHRTADREVPVTSRTTR